MTTKEETVGALLSYMRHELSLSQLVDWAEDTLLEADFSDGDMDVLTQVLGRLGLADVRAFGLAWEDCEELVRTLGYRLQVEVLEAA